MFSAPLIEDDLSEAALAGYRDEIRAGGCIRLTVTTRSMWPLLRPGDRVIVRAGDPAPGRIAVLFKRGVLLVHRIRHVDARCLTAAGDANFSPDPPIPIDRFLGVVTHLERGPNQISLGSAYGHLLSMLCRPIGRFFACRSEAVRRLGDSAAVLATRSSAFRRSGRAAHRLAARIFARSLGRGASVYLTRGCARGDDIPGLSDIDMVVFADSESLERRTSRVHKAAKSLFPAFGDLAVLPKTHASFMFQKANYSLHEAPGWKLLAGADLRREAEPLSSICSEVLYAREAFTPLLRISLLTAVALPSEPMELRRLGRQIEELRHLCAAWRDRVPLPESALAFYRRGGLPNPSITDAAASLAEALEDLEGAAERSGIFAPPSLSPTRRVHILGLPFDVPHEESYLWNAMTTILPIVVPLRDRGRFEDTIRHIPAIYAETHLRPCLIGERFHSILSAVEVGRCLEWGIPSEDKSQIAWRELVSLRQLAGYAKTREQLAPVLLEIERLERSLTGGRYAPRVEPPDRSGAATRGTASLREAIFARVEEIRAILADRYDGA